MGSLRTAALLLADDEELEHAVELAALAKRESPSGHILWAPALWGGQFAAVATRLPADVAALAQARGQARDLWATAQELLAELEAAGWDAGGSGGVTGNRDTPLVAAQPCDNIDGLAAHQPLCLCTTPKSVM